MLFGAATCLAVYTHYTAAFVLGAQLLWLFWAHPDARRPAALASVAAAVLFMPWMPGLIADGDSPTVDILSAIQGDGLEKKLEAIAVWIIGLPYVDLPQVPGEPALIIALAAMLAAAAAGAGALVEGASAAAGRGSRGASCSSSPSAWRRRWPRHCSSSRNHRPVRRSKPQRLLGRARSDDRSRAGRGRAEARRRPRGRRHRRYSVAAVKPLDQTTSSSAPRPPPSSSTRRREATTSSSTASRSRRCP